MSSYAPSSQIFHLTYVSTMTFSARLRSSTLADIADKCKKNNAINHLNGVIVFKQGKFLQYLEGDEMKIMHLYQVILQDKRHKNVQILSKGVEIKSRFTQQEMYCFGTDDSISGEEITPLLEKFDTYRWQPADVEQVVMDFANYHPTPLSHAAYAVKVESYLFTLIKQFILRHAVFLALQAVLLLIFIAISMYFFWKI